MLRESAKVTPPDERSNRKQKFEEKNESTKFTESVLKSEERALYVYCESQLEDQNSNSSWTGKWAFTLYGWTRFDYCLKLGVNWHHLLRRPSTFWLRLYHFVPKKGICFYFILFNFFGFFQSGAELFLSGAKIFIRRKKCVSAQIFWPLRCIPAETTGTEAQHRQQHSRDRQPSRAEHRRKLVIKTFHRPAGRDATNS